MYKFILQPLLFLLDAEKAHRFTFALVKLGFKIPFVRFFIKKIYASKDKPTEVFGLKFKNKIGLAAGFDKNAELIDELACFGFGFIEIGTVTPKPQAGNSKPRLFRLKKDKAIINRMGFNNDGLEAIVQRLKKRKTDILIGGNIGKNKVTPNENALDDYVICFEGLFDYVDYFVVNVSSPNTPNLRALQDKAPLTNILNTLQEKNLAKAQAKPILLKIAPDLNSEQLDDIVEVVLDTKIAGLIATNTTISRENLKTSKDEIEKIANGGLSGKPLVNRSTEVIKYIKEKSKGQFPIIAVGGVKNAQTTQEKLDAGASLVQVYTGFVYEGPSLIKKINKKL